MPSPSDIKGIRERLEQFKVEFKKDKYFQLSDKITHDVDSLLSHIEALEERLRKAEPEPCDCFPAREHSDHCHFNPAS